MGPQDRIYRPTEAGLKAWRSQKSGLSVPYRRILRLVQGDTHFAVIRAAMGICQDSQLVEWLQQLETLGFVESESAGAECDLDFTASVISVAALAARYKLG